MTDLRPLILVEAVRKIWSELILRKMQHVWRQSEPFDDGQNGFLAGRGTETAALMHLGILEEMRERKMKQTTMKSPINRGGFESRGSGRSSSAGIDLVEELHEYENIETNDTYTDDLPEGDTPFAASADRHPGVASCV